jgi:hypothetical protein
MSIISVLLISAGAIGMNLQIVSKEPPATEAQVVAFEKRIGAALPADLLPIAFDAGSNQVLLGISGMRKGKVYYWAMDFAPVEDLPEPTYDNIAFVADSFTDFLKKLRPMDCN